MCKFPIQDPAGHILIGDLSFNIHFIQIPYFYINLGSPCLFNLGTPVSYKLVTLTLSTPLILGLC